MSSVTVVRGRVHRRSQGCASTAATCSGPPPHSKGPAGPPADAVPPSKDPHEGFKVEITEFSTKRFVRRVRTWTLDEGGDEDEDKNGKRRRRRHHRKHRGKKKSGHPGKKHDND